MSYNLNKDYSKTTEIVCVDENNTIIKKLHVKNGSKNIFGVVNAPFNYENKKLPTVIISHGFNNDFSFMYNYAKSIAEKGYIVYSFDFSGGSVTSKSDGDIKEMSIFTQKDDLKAVINTLLNYSFVDKDNIFLLGYSQGGVVSSITAVDNSKLIKGLILLSPAFVLFDDAKKLFHSVEDIPDIYHHKGSDLGKIYFENLLDYNICSVISNFEKNVLIIHGDNDKMVPIKYSKKAVYGFKNARLEIINDAGHIYNQGEIQKMIPIIIDFLNKNTNKIK